MPDAGRADPNAGTPKAGKGILAGGMRIAGTSSGVLAGRTFTAKDLFDVADHTTGGGNPDWAAAAQPAPIHAAAVQRLLDAGATLVGKTVTDEISLGLFGDNAFDGMPDNPAAPGHLPGGSSSGAASAVAGGECDIGLATDTAGSTRVPASFCGLFGLRSTHGRVRREGMMAQAPSSDTVGWLAHDPAAFLQASSVLLDENATGARGFRLLVAQDAFGYADPATRAALAPLVERLGRRAKAVATIDLAPEGLDRWAAAQRTLQLSEAWETFRAWVDRVNPRMSFTVARILVQASQVTSEAVAAASHERDKIRQRVWGLLEDDVVLCLPTTPAPAPLAGQPISALDGLRARMVGLCCMAGLTGVPQVSMPGSSVDGLPIGLSLVAARSRDMAVVELATEMVASDG